MSRLNTARCAAVAAAAACLASAATVAHAASLTSVTQNLTVTPAPGSALPLNGPQTFVYSYSKFNDNLGQLVSFTFQFDEKFNFGLTVSDGGSGGGGANIGGSMVVGSYGSFNGMGNSASGGGGAGTYNFPINVSATFTENVSSFGENFLGYFHAPGGGTGSFEWQTTISGSVGGDAVFNAFTFLPTSTAKLTYNYIPAPVPTPAALGGGLALLGLLAAKRRRA